MSGGSRIGVVMVFGAGLGLGLLLGMAMNSHSGMSNAQEALEAGAARDEHGEVRSVGRPVRPDVMSPKMPDTGYLALPYGVVEANENWDQRLYHSAASLDTLVVETIERYQGETQVDSDEFVASFEIVTIGHRFANEFFVGGETGRGWGVIEKWTRLPRGGAPTRVSSTGVPPAIGTPAAPTTLQEAWVGGGFVPPSDRSGIRELNREEVLIATPSTPVPDSIGVDPEGRFLLVIAEDGNLYQLDLASAEPELILVFSAAELPALGSVCSMAAGQHASYGRIWYVRTEQCGGPYDVLLFDYDNDGVLDDFHVDDALSLLVSDYIDSPAMSWY